MYVWIRNINPYMYLTISTVADSSRHSSCKKVKLYIVHVHVQCSAEVMHYAPSAEINWVPVQLFWTGASMQCNSCYFNTAYQSSMDVHAELFERKLYIFLMCTYIHVHWSGKTGVYFQSSGAVYSCSLNNIGDSSKHLGSEINLVSSTIYTPSFYM